MRVSAELGLRHHVGACVTASHVVSSRDAKGQLGLATGALAVEQESYWIGLACRELNVPFFTVRSIIDTAESPLPPFTSRLAQDGKFGGRWRRVVPIMVRPWYIPTFIHLARAASEARDSLTTFTVGFLNSRTGDGHRFNRQAHEDLGL